MYCKQINKKFKGVAISELSMDKATYLVEHAKTCETCTNELDREKLLNRLCERSAKDDDSYMIPINMMRSRVELQLKEKQTLSRQSRKIPSVKWVSSVSVALIFLTIIYFGGFQSKQSIPNEYEVALSGISPVMVDDKEIICDMLYNTGLPEASYDVIGCESTCDLVIFNLNSFEEATRVVDMFHSLQNSEITTNVTRLEKSNRQVI